MNLTFDASEDYSKKCGEKKSRQTFKRIFPRDSCCLICFMTTGGRGHFYKENFEF